MKKLYILVTIIMMIMIPTSSFAVQSWSLSLSGPGWYVNLANSSPFIPGYQQYYYFTPVIPHVMHQAPIYYIDPPKQLMRVCGPVYFVQTPSGFVQQQQCWMEWR